MRVLFVVPYAPTLIRTRPYNLLRSLAQRGHTLTVATLWETKAERAAIEALAGLGMEVIAAPLNRPRTLLNAVGALAGGQPLQARYCWQPALAQRLAKRLQQPGPAFDLVHVEHLRGAEYGHWIHQRWHGRHQAAPVVWDSVDCISLLFEQTARHSLSRLGRWRARLELARTRRYEGASVRAFAGVLATSPRDAEALAALATGTSQAPRVRVLPNGVDSSYFEPSERPASETQVVLSGKMSYHANVTAALKLVNEIMPHVWRQCPDVQVVIAGSAPPPAVRRLASARVRVTGSVPDLRPHLHSATVAAAPITYGAGIQNKVLEAMACGLPVVASPQASSALEARPGEELLVAGDPVAFSEALVRLLADPALRQRLGQAGRQYVIRRHGWGGIVESLERMYDDIISAAH